MHQTTTDAFDRLACGDSAAVPPCEVIVAVEPPLFRDLLTRLIGRIDGLHIRAKLAGPSGLAPLLEQIDAQWVVVTLDPDGQMPDAIDSIVANHPSVSVLGVAMDGTGIQVESGGAAVEVLANPSLAVLIGVLMQRGGQGQEKKGESE